MQAWEENRWEPPARSAPVTRVLVGINIAVFVLQMLVGDTASGRLGWMSYYFGLSREGLGSGYVWQVVTYMFLHGGVFHIFANMLVIYFAGSQIERLLGARKMLTIYFLGGIVGGLVQTALSPGLLVGASAAGFAVLIAFTTILPELQMTLLLFFVLPVRLKAKHLALGAFSVSLVFTIFPPGDNVGHVAHLFGCITGWICAQRLGFGKVSTPPPLPDWLLNRSTGQGPREADIDRILNKISLHGMHSLTREERHVLEAGRERIARRSNIR